MSFRHEEATCKVCKKAIVVQIAEEYEGDAMGLRQLATCNRCYDLLTKRNNATELISRACANIIGARGQKSASKLIEAARRALEAGTKSYASVIAEYHNSPTMIWNDDFVDLLIQKPEQWHRILSQYRDGARAKIKEIKAAHVRTEALTV